MTKKWRPYSRTEALDQQQSGDPNKWVLEYPSHQHFHPGDFCPRTNRVGANPFGKNGENELLPGGMLPLVLTVLAQPKTDGSAGHYPEKIN